MRGLGQKPTGEEVAAGTRRVGKITEECTRVEVFVAGKVKVSSSEIGYAILEERPQGNLRNRYHSFGKKVTTDTKGQEWPMAADC